MALKGKAPFLRPICVCCYKSVNQMAAEPAAAVAASTLIGTEAKGQTSRQFGISNATSPKFTRSSLASVMALWDRRPQEICYLV